MEIAHEDGEFFTNFGNLTHLTFLQFTASNIIFQVTFRRNAHWISLIANKMHYNYVYAIILNSHESCYQHKKNRIQFLNVLIAIPVTFTYCHSYIWNLGIRPRPLELNPWYSRGNYKHRKSHFFICTLCRPPLRKERKLAGQQ